jgi:photosystem II stability/assembly factor-like uncharacterized protein
MIRTKHIVSWSVAAFMFASIAGAQIDPDRLAGLKARNIGPAGMSGRTTVVEAVASNPNVVFAGAASGGVWKSANSGLTWTPIFEDQPVHSIGSIAVFQPNPSIVWVGTGEANLRNSASVGDGIYKSSDGGKTWKHLGLEKTEHIYRVMTHPSNPDVAYVCATGQEWGENPERGVFRTDDGGKSWQKILYVDEKTGCGDLVMDPSNPQKLMAGMWQFRRWPWFFKSGGPGSSLYVTNDGGASWTRRTAQDGLPSGELGRIGIAIFRANPSIIYALVEAEKSALVRSDDGGLTWKTVNEDPNVAPRPFYFCDIRVDPALPNRVYSLDFGIRVSNDSGRTFELLAASRQLHGDNHAMWIDPADGTHLYIGDDGGVSESRDRGQTARFVGNLPFAQFYHVAVDREQPYNVYGGLQDNGSWRGPSAVWQAGGIRNYLWQLVGDGDGFDVQPDPRDSLQGYSLSQGGYLNRYNLKTGEIKWIRPNPPNVGTKLRFNWNTALAVDPFEPGTVYLGSQFVHKSTDRGETWTIISPDLTTNDPEKQKQDESGGLTPDVSNAENYTTLLAIAPSPVEKGVIWTGSDDGQLHVTRDGGKTWTAVESNIKGVPVNTWIPHIEPSPIGGATAFVVFDNHRRSDWTPYVFRTDDYGKTWRSLASGSVRGYALSIRQDLVKGDLLFLGTEFGLYVSFDGGGHWTLLKKTLPTASVMDMVIHPREHDLVLATHGRAVWILDDIRPLRELTESALNEPLKLYEIADAQQHRVRADVGGFAQGAAEFHGEDRPYGAILTYSMNMPGLPLANEERERERREQDRQKDPAAKTPELPQVEIRITDEVGTLIRTFKAPARLGVNRAAWDLKCDPFKQPPRANTTSPFDQEPVGPEAPPGTYTVTMKYDTHEARQTVKVLPDPRYTNATDDWKRRWDTIQKARAFRDQVVDAVWRIRTTRDDVDTVTRKVRETAQRTAEADPAAADGNPLIKDGDHLKQGLTGLERKVWQAPEFKGAIPGNDALSTVGRVLASLGSSWDPPNATQLEYLSQAEATVRLVLTEVDRFFAGEVTAYREKVKAAGIGLLP